MTDRRLTKFNRQKRRNARQQKKRLKTIKDRYGDNAFKSWGSKAETNLEAASRGGQVSPSNFKNDRELASRAGKISKPNGRQVKI